MVKCADSGFLALRNTTSGALDEAPMRYRETAEPPKLRRADVKFALSEHEFYDYPYSKIPACFVNVVRLDKEIAGVTPDFDQRIPPREVVAHMDRWERTNPKPDRIVEAIQRDRGECRGFYQWEQGFAPKAHYEMADKRRIQEEQARQQHADRRWRLVELAILVAVAGVFTILGAFIGRGTIP